MDKQWQLSLMLVLKKKTVLCRFGTKDWDISVRKDYRFKHEAFGKFKEKKWLVENQTWRTVKKLRTDNGLEFCNREFERLCVESGISGLPKTFWAEATCTTAYLINKSPSTTIEKKTLMEIWSRHPSDYGMLRIFGCVVYSHVKQGKIEPKAVKCILFGYPKGVKGYRLYRFDDETPKIVTSRNLVFNENVMYKDTLKDSGAGADKSVEELQVELVRDREPRTKTKPMRFQDESNMVAYAFVTAKEEDTHELLTYQEAVSCEDSSKWKAAIKEEMDLIRKSKT
ncbi:retrotransposon protein, putative, ty1-copia subclass [Tanacetum coccineum]